MTDDTIAEPIPKGYEPDAIADALNFLADMVDGGRVDSVIIITLSNDHKPLLEAQFVGDTEEIPNMMKRAEALLREQLHLLHKH